MAFVTSKNFTLNPEGDRTKCIHEKHSGEHSFHRQTSFSNLQKNLIIVMFKTLQPGRDDTDTALGRHKRDQS